MKIAITGHSKGIGKELYDIFDNDHQVEGFSRSNGFDIATQHQLIARSVKNFDVFVNNAWSGYHQIDLLNTVFEMWKNDSSKKIVNISSLSKYPGLSGNTSGYAASKAALSHQAFLLMFETDRKCKMINVNPGYVKTDMTKKVHNTASMLTAKECADAIAWAINQPQHIEICELSLWCPFQ